MLPAALHEGILVAPETRMCSMPYAGKLRYRLPPVVVKGGSDPVQVQHLFCYVINISRVL